MDTKPVVVSCELHWPFLNKQNEMSGKYQVDIGKLSSKATQSNRHSVVSMQWSHR